MIIFTDNFNDIIKMKKLTTNDFILKSKEKHGDKYDYSESEYIDSKTNVKIICPNHGLFLQNPQSHYNGSECPICSKTTRVISRLGNNDLIKQSFIDKSNLIHNFKYNYDKVIYVNSQTKVCIICPEHGEFLQIPNDHSQGSNCPICAKRKKRDDITIEIPNELDYIIVNYKKANKGYIIGTVYLFINKINNKKYIGETISSIANRFSAHYYNIFKESSTNNYFYRAIAKYGWDNFDKFIIYQTDEIINTPENKKIINKEICDKEKEFISLFKSNVKEYGYNSTDGGEGISNYTHSEEVKKQMSESRKGEGNSMYGKTLEKNPRSIPILQLDLDNNIIKRWSCAVEINQELGYSITMIRNCYNGKYEIYKGYKWVKEKNYGK